MIRNWRLVCKCILISLPSVLLIVAGIHFVVGEVPKLVQNAVAQEYRSQAVKAKDAGNGAEFDFNASGRKRTNYRIQNESWGFEKDKVWYFKNGKSYLVDVPPVLGYDLAKNICPICVIVMLLFAGLTVFAVFYFWKFVRSRDDFLAATAHDLTTPLVGMRMMIGRHDDEVRKLNERMLLIVSNIKDFMRLGGKRRAPTPKPVNVVALCKEAYQLFAADFEASESGAVEISDAGAGEQVVAFSDETMTLQILWNLFGNDLKYAAPYGKVSVSFGLEARQVRVEFADEGQGMSPWQMRRAFDRYYRARTVLESGKGGFGIGLCTAREFARAMGGDLTVRANRPKGCVFSLILPRAN